MSDNTVLNAGTGGDTVRTIDRTSAKTQVIALDVGGEAGPESLVTTGNPLPTINEPSENHMGAVGGHTAVVSASFTRPANTTAYATGNLVANNTVAASVAALAFANSARVAGGSGMVRRIRLVKSGTTLTNATFRVHLWRAPIATITSGDGAAIAASGSADYLGAADIAIDQAWSDGSWGAGVSRTGGEMNFHLPSGTTIYGLIEAKAAYAPVSGETFTAYLEIVQD